jgi:hypothetical protein
VAVTLVVAVGLRDAESVDVAQGEVDAVFDAGALGATTSLAPTPVMAAASSTLPASTTSTSTTLPVLPRRTVVVGDSTAHSLATNAPKGLDAFLELADGSISGCSVQSDGRIRSSRDGFSWSFEACADWDTTWATAASDSGAEVALVVIGAWDVFDVEVDGRLVQFGTPAGDERFLAGVQRGIDALRAVGVHAALLEVPCMRPQDVEGAGVPALPERGDDSRVAHLNDLLRQAADANPGAATFITGPAAWCSDPGIASSLAYRWDGVHVYDEGAKLEFEAITTPLLQIPL